MNKGFVYILLSNKDKKSYVGSTFDLAKRFQEHSLGLVISTKNRRPLRIIYTEEYNTLSEARKRESYLKTRQGRRELKQIFLKLKY